MQSLMIPSIIFRWLRWLFFSVGFLLSFRSLLATQSERLPVLIVEQNVKSPTADGETAARQRLTIDLANDRVMLEVLPSNGSSRSLRFSDDGANRVILRMDVDPPRIYEVIDDEKRYRLKIGDLNRLQEERDLQEMNEIRRAKRLPLAERNKLLASAFLREDGERNVEVRKDGSKKIKGYNCQEITVTENGRQVIKASMTKEIAGGRSFYQLYGRLGAFSEKVLENIADLEGLPLEATIKVITAGPAFDLEAEVTRVLEHETVPSDFFELPADYKVKKELPPIVPCPVCGKDVERDAPPGGQFVEPVSGEKKLFCSKECWQTFVRKYEENLRRQQDR